MFPNNSYKAYSTTDSGTPNSKIEINNKEIRFKLLDYFFIQ